MDVLFSADQLRRVLGSAEGRAAAGAAGRRRRRTAAAGGGGRKGRRPRAGAGDLAAGLADGAGAGAAAKARWMSSSARCALYWTTLRSCRSCGRSQARSASVSRMRPRRRKPLCRPCRPRLRLPRSRRSRRCRRPVSLPEPAAAMLRQAGKADKKQEALLLALKPFLRKDRQSKIDRALQAARLASLASLALKNRGRGPGPKETP